MAYSAKPRAWFEFRGKVTDDEFTAIPSAVRGSISEFFQNAFRHGNSVFRNLSPKRHFRQAARCLVSAGNLKTNTGQKFRSANEIIGSYPEKRTAKDAKNAEKERGGHCSNY
jgi:hypothetical protein